MEYVVAEGSKHRLDLLKFGRFAAGEDCEGPGTRRRRTSADRRIDKSDSAFCQRPSNQPASIRLNRANVHECLTCACSFVSTARTDKDLFDVLWRGKAGEENIGPLGDLGRRKRRLRTLRDEFVHNSAAAVMRNDGKAVAD
jgi:hypothetical protein